MTKDYIQIAKSEIGVKEIVGGKHEPRVLEYFRASGHPEVLDDETAWCSAFLNWVMAEAGYTGTMSLAARSWLKWGQKVEPQANAILIFKRGNSTWQGHVTFYLGETATHYKCVGGNQSNMVNIAYYPKSSLLGARMPSTMAGSRTVAAMVGGSGATALGFISEQANSVLPIAQEAASYIQWFQYVAVGLSLLCFGLGAYFRWRDMVEKGR